MIRPPVKIHVAIKTAGTALAVFLLLLTAGCGMFKPEPPADALAVVGDEWITEEDVLDVLRQMGIEYPREQDIARYVNNWVDTRLLVYEARENGLHRDSEFKRRIATLEDDLLINSLIEVNTVVDTPASSDVVEYWKNHTGEYTRVAKEVNLVIAYVDSKNSAWRLREAFDQSATATQMVEEIGVSRIDTLTNLSVSRLPREIATAIQPLRSGHSSLPVEYHGEWMIVKLLDRFQEGRTRPFDEVADVVRDRMMAELRGRSKLEYVEALRREARQSGLVRIRLGDGSTEPVSVPSHEETVDSVDVDIASPVTEE